MKSRERGTTESAESEASVVTRMRFRSPIEETWSHLTFYEQIPGRPPLHLRLLLPAPVRTEGHAAAAGDETICVYEEGTLRKRLRRVEAPHLYEFDVVEQNLEVGGGIRLAGGSYTLHKLPGGGTRVELLTRYRSPRRPRWLWAPLEANVCHAFHRYILGAMRKALAAKASLRPGLAQPEG